MSSGFIDLVRAIVSDNRKRVAQLTAAAPGLVFERAADGATRKAAEEFFLEEIRHYLYAGDTALHVAAAGFRWAIAQDLIDQGASISARNRRGAEPLHYAADANMWNPVAQAATIASLIRAGANPNALDKSGVAPLHRAVRTRSAAAVRALLDGGAKRQLRNGKGSTPLQLATWTTGRGGSGTPRAIEQQKEIARLLR